MATECQDNRLKDLLFKWVHGRTDIVSAHLNKSYGSYLFVVVRNAVRYDPMFDDELTDLDLAIAEDPELQHVRFNTIGLPPVSDAALASFVDQNTSTVIYAKENE